MRRSARILTSLRVEPIIALFGKAARNAALSVVGRTMVYAKNHTRQGKAGGEAPQLMFF
jgi:hypothetical protein